MPVATECASGHDFQSLDRRITGHEGVGSPGDRFSNDARVIVVHRRDHWFSGSNVFVCSRTNSMILSERAAGSLIF
jgi:hypothetical protein